MITCLPLLKGNGVFQSCSSGFLASVAIMLRETTFAADETLFCTNDVCSDLFIIASSTILVTAPAAEGQTGVRLLFGL